MRNFDVAGYGVGASNDPCSNTYMGTSRNSEIETRVASDAILRHSYNIRVALSLHSIGMRRAIEFTETKCAFCERIYWRVLVLNLLKLVM